GQLERAEGAAKNARDATVRLADQAYSNKEKKSCALLNELIAFDYYMNEGLVLNCDDEKNDLTRQQKIKALSESVNQVKAELAKLGYFDSELGKDEGNGKIFSAYMGDNKYSRD